MRACLFGVLLAGCPVPDKDDDDDDGGGLFGEGSGSVEVTGADDFGDVRSTVWIRVDLGDGLVLDEVLLSTVPGMCEKYTAYWEAYEAYEAAAEEISDEAWCREGKAITLAYYDTLSALAPAESSVLAMAQLDFYGSDTDWRWQEGSFRLGEDAWATAQWTEGDPYADAASQWDESSTRDESCGVEPDEGATRAFEVTGTLDVASVADEVNTTGELAGELLEDEETVGSITASFDATWCPLE
ncbi:MAG: hypothetical protein ACOZNI_06610 [Myxococcota bacterium]